MKTVTILIISLLLMVGVVYAKNYEVNKKAGDYSIVIRINKNLPVTGKNNVDIAITDASGKAVTDATVATELSMAPMPGMPAANYKSKAELKGGTYKTVIEPSMAGPWNFAVKVTKGGKTETVKMSLDVK